MAALHLLYDSGVQAGVARALASSGARSVLELTSLTLYQEPYASLDGIECLKNLEWLGLSVFFPEGERPTLDLSPLAKLESLAELYVSSTGFSHLESLANGPLRELGLQTVDADSLEPLRGFTRLEHLELSTLSASDLSPLATLDSLQWLQLQEMPVTTLAPLANLPALEILTLVLGSDELESLEGLVNLPQLTDLRLSVASLRSLEGIGSVPKLRRIEIGGSDELETLDGLEACTGLESIVMNGKSNIADLSALEEVQTLKLLDAAHAKISDLGALANLAKLEHLNLKANQVTDLSPLANLRLKWLDVSDNQVDSIDALANQPLVSLWLSHNPIQDLDELATLDGLEELAIEGLGADSLELLRGHPIRNLWASDNDISDISVVTDWHLENLILANNEIVELPSGFIGAQGFCSLTDLVENPLNMSAKEALQSLCKGPRTGPGYSWDGGDCPAVCEVP